MDLLKSRLYMIAIGTVALSAGVLVYLIDRPPEETYFVVKTVPGLSAHGILPNLFGRIGNSFPAFVHPFSFALLTAGVMARSMRGCLVSCLVWFFLDAVFELGQHFKSISLGLLPTWFDGVPYLEACRDFFLRGTFDFYDLAAITLGTAAAYAVMTLLLKRTPS